MTRSGFIPGIAGTTGREAMAQFMEVLAGAPENARYEVGVMWLEPDGWSAYQRIGETALRMSPREARKIANYFERYADKPRWAGARDWALDTAKTLRDIAAECDQNNRDGIKPEGWQVTSPARGSS